MELSSRSSAEELAVLADERRRALYEAVVASDAPVSRDDAAAAVGISRSLAAYHLDLLVEHGLLRTHFERRSGRRGPGAGRPTKLYERSRREFRVELPPRRYELAARLMASALEPASDRALADVAHDAGADLARETPGRGRGCLVESMRRCGYEPQVSGGEIRLRNCPFHALAEEHRELVCGMNLAFVRGLVEGSGAGGSPVLDPQPDECCVAVLPAKRAS